MFTLKEDLDIAVAIADRASHLAIDFFNEGVTGSTKADGTLVTDADRAVEQVLRTTIQQLRPEDGILGEEFGESGKSSRVWIIDPIDGTSSFVNRDSDWRVQLALEIHGQIKVAVVVAPAQGICWWAMSGGGAFESRWPLDIRIEPTVLSVSMIDERSSARVQGYPLDSVVQRLGGWNVSCPDSLVPYKVIRGELEAFIFQACYAWDHAPWVLLVQEAGGSFVDWEGGLSARKAGGIFSNTTLHRRLRSAILTD